MVRHAMKALVLISPVLVLALALLVAPAHAGSWDEENTRLHIPLTALMFIDLGQTLYIADHPEKYYEMNILLSKYPSRKEVTEYFVLSYLTVTGLTWALPSKWSHGLQKGKIFLSLCATTRNTYVGIGFSF